MKQVIVMYHILRLLDALMLLTEGLNISSLAESEINTEVILSLQSSFAVAVQQINRETFETTGQTLAATFGDDSRVQRDLAIDAINLEFSNSSMTIINSTASITLPGILFNNISNTSGLIHFVFLTDTLFLRRNKNYREVGSIIVAASITGTTISGLNDQPIILHFLRNPVSSS